MADDAPRYRFRGAIKPTAEVKRPVSVARNADATGASGAKSTSATIDIFDVIDSWGGWWGVSAAEVDEALSKLGKVDTLYVRVNSPGGEATEGVAIANLLRAHAAAVKVTNYGLAASAASLIAVSGDTLAMAPGSLLMIHEAWNVVRGSADDMRAEAAVLDKISDSYAACYALKGGTSSDWRALMHAETWFTPEDAVTAGLADQVGIDVAPGAPVAPDDEPDVPIEVNVDIEITPAARAAQRFDLSLFRHVPEPIAALAANKPPAQPPEKHPHQKEDVTMTPEDIKALRERLGLAEDAGTSAINAKLDELEEQATKPDGGGDPVAAVAKAHNLKPEQVTAALAKVGKDDEPTVPEGKVLVSETLLDELKSNAKLGADARAKQLEQERDETIEAAFKAGKISADRRDAWTKAWDKDPEGTKADLASLEVRFPVANATGYAGSDGADGEGTKPFTDDEAEGLAALAGVSKEALIHG